MTELKLDILDLDYELLIRNLCRELGATQVRLHRYGDKIPVDFTISVV